jgi:5-methyltetrahydrofolate--homocysteine methyltransferase
MPSTFEKALSQRIIILDGAMGTAIQNYKLTEDDYIPLGYENHPIRLKGNHDLLVLTRPDVLKAIHEAYLEAGADLIETNTFNANSVSQADYKLDHLAYTLNLEAAKLCRSAADTYSTPERPRFVAGSVGPTNKTASLSPRVEDPAYRNVSFDELVAAYHEQMKGLMDGGVDVLLIETIFDTLNAKAALFAAEVLFEESGKSLPIMISVTLTDKSGRTLSGQTLDAFVASIKSSHIISFGLNCSFGAKELAPYVEYLSEHLPYAISVYPNAGLPNRFGEYDELPADTVSFLSYLFEERHINIVGGCCGTTPDHIAAIAKFAQDKAPRSLPEKKDAPMVLAGLEAVKLTPDINFVNVGERTNVSGSAKFAKLIRAKAYNEALEIAREQVENGAQIIDINFDDGMLDAAEEMSHFLKLIAAEPDIARVPIMIDSSKWEVLEAGLKAIQGKPVVNSISMKSGEADFIEKAKLIKRYNAAIVVMAFDELGQADTFERKTQVCARAYDLLVNTVGFPKEDIIFDPNILAVATGIEEHNSYAVDFIKATAWIKANLSGAKISGGVSNLSFSFRGNNPIREAMHTVFLYHAIHAGMDMAIVNPGMILPYDEIEPELLKAVEAVILNTHPEASEELLEFAEHLLASGETKVETQAETILLPLEERLKQALITGKASRLHEDLEEALTVYYPALKIIEGPLMAGMSIVGDRFGEGKMFLPQVVKSARVMKQAVEQLLPHINAQDSKQSAKLGKILMATVKGDVHDIGKNIVGVVLACNNIEVIDLGIMVSAEEIIDAAIAHNVDVIGLSGLITPSLEEMAFVAKSLEHRGLHIPVIIGGATTSKIHTAVKIEPHYPNRIFHATDASKTVEIVKSLLDSEKRAHYIMNHQEGYGAIRAQYQDLQKQLAPYSDAYERRYVLDLDSVAPQPNHLGLTPVSYSVHELRKTIDWTFFFTSWGLMRAYPGIFDDPRIGTEAKLLYDDANLLLDALEKDTAVALKGILGLFKAHSHQDQIVLTDTDGATLESFPCLRQQSMDGTTKSLADYIAPLNSDTPDYLGLFAVSSGSRLQALYEKAKEDQDDYQAIMIKLIADRLAESFAERIHLDTRKHYWGYAPDENLDNKALFKSEFQGIRPAIGYPSLPDHSEKERLFKVLDVEKHTGLTLTDSFMMTPVSSVCGLIFAHPDATYFSISKISADQVLHYANQKNQDEAFVRRMLGHHIQ